MRKLKTRVAGASLVSVLTVGLAAIGFGALAVFGLLGLLDQVKGSTFRLWAPSVSAVVAATSLLLTGFTYDRSSRRERRARTVAAWTSYRDKTDKLIRRQLSTADGTTGAAVTKEEVRVLMGLRSKTLAATDADERLLIERAHDIIAILNRLERLAVGCEHGLYDPWFLSKLGGTPIQKVYKRLKPFIDGARGEQGTAFESIIKLHASITEMRGPLAD